VTPPDMPETKSFWAVFAGGNSDPVDCAVLRAFGAGVTFMQFSRRARVQWRSVLLTVLLKIDEVVPTAAIDSVLSKGDVGTYEADALVGREYFRP
jgi:hypothetical protein